MEKRTELYRGKAKTVYTTDNPERLILHFRNDTSAFDGKKMEQLDRKGMVNNKFNAFIMQKLEGNGMAFVHAGGTLAKRELQAGETLKVDTGCIVGFTQNVDYDIEFVGGIKNTIFGGEGLFFAKLQGPGTVYIQSLPFSRLAGRVLANAPQGGGRDKGEGSILGGLGDLLDGDNRF